MGVPAQCSRGSAALLVFPQWFCHDGFFFISHAAFSARSLLTPSSFSVCLFFPLAIFLVQISWLENRRCRVGFYYYYLAWSITATLEPRGVFHRKGKDITFTVKKSLYLMSFPPSFPSREQQCPRKGGEAVLEGAAMPRGALRSGRAVSIHLPSSLVFSWIFIFSA